jgi:hypothetical protein
MIYTITLRIVELIEDNELNCIEVQEKKESYIE